MRWLNYHAIKRGSRRFTACGRPPALPELATGDLWLSRKTTCPVWAGRFTHFSMLQHAQAFLIDNSRFPSLSIDEPRSVASACG
jgi:hypothetical protein